MRIHQFGRLMLLILIFEMMLLQLVGGTDVDEDTVDIFELIQRVSTGLGKAWNDNNYLPLEGVIDQIHHMEEHQTKYFPIFIDTLRHKFDAQSLLSNWITNVGDIADIIVQRYQLMIYYNKYKDNVQQDMVQIFANWTVQPVHSVEKLHNSAYGKDDLTQSLFSKLVVEYETDLKQVCALKRSAHQFAYDLYSMTTLTEIKGYITLVFSWMVLRDRGLGNFTDQMSQMNAEHQQRMLDSRQILRKVLRYTGRTYWRCDPQAGNHVLGKTYAEITRLMQGYLENEINLSAESSCYETCEDYQDARVEGCHKDTICKDEMKCTGRVHSCRLIGSEMNVCHGNETTLRRYEFISYDNGDRRECRGGFKQAKSFSYHGFWRCDYCFCLCDEPAALSDRFFSLRQTISDFQQNKVVTGARFIKHQRVFYLQLQQGELLPSGLINQSTLDWIPLQTFDVTHVDIRSGFDYHELSRKSRSLDLDEITTDNDSLIVTGARFRVIDNHLNLEVRFSQLNFTTGRLLQPDVNSFWLGNNANKPREKLRLKNPDKSSRTPYGSAPLSTDNQFMEFISSSIDMDAAQSTVPFIDIQDVVTNPALPISGLGIYHKGFKGFGGFFAPKIVTFNFLKQLLEPQS